MSISKHTVIDKIEIVGEHKCVQVRTATVILEDDVEISRSFHRHVITPKDDYSNETDEIKVICKTVFTDDVINNYNQYLQELTAGEQDEHTD